MNLRQIEVFRAVMQAGSVTGAARLLNVSQPGISRMLGHVELQLGLHLFERGRGRLSPTPEAQALHAEVERLYAGVRHIDDVVRQLKAGGGPALRVLASPSTALDVVPRAVAALTARHPAARLYIEAQLAREMVARLLHHEADIAICTLPIEHPLLRTQVVGSWSLAAVLARGHALARRRTLGQRDLMAQPLIAFSADTPQGRFLAQWQASAEEATSNVGATGPRIEVRSGQLACALAANGAGVAVVDDLTARACAGERLQARPLRSAPTFEAHAVWRADAAPSRLALAFVDQVRLAFDAVRQATPLAGRRP